ncbi:L,D-transpeptidase family protein [Zhongshania sp. BJYM1]|uniref:L,D-transpeptidase family protein n=1 Tax=Zhongshania aquatica TaxID=2965069 RepID=UPI0022B3D750|nr:L,D-transpeptidase family protein [Marortus sp. BJYM1]
MKKFTFHILLLTSLFFNHGALAGAQLQQTIESWLGGYPAILKEETVLNKDILNKFYIERNFEAAWLDSKGLTKQGRELLGAIASINEEGLLPADYHGARVLAILTASISPQDTATYDLLLSDAFLTLASHLISGKVDPKDLNAEWEANRRHSDLQLLLENALKQGDISAALDGLRTKQTRYFRLKKALATMRLLPNTAWKQKLAESPAIKPSASDNRIPVIAKRLQVWGDLSLQQPSNETAQTYSAVLVESIKAFQGRHGLDADGVIGRETIKALNISPRERAKQIVVNMERWRWLAENLGDKYLLVNIAAFELKIIDNNQTVFVKPVVVGRNYRKTPVFSNKIRYIVLNPTWTVPYKLAVEDKLSEIQKDPAYLNRLGIRVFKGDSPVPIDPFSISWNEINKRNFPFRLVQSPGPQNALGQVKFMFPNPHDVYLHDTPSRELFKKAERAFSSGCIRVSDPLELAEFLLRSQGWDKTRIAAVIENGETETVTLKTPVPIHIEYWTTWVDREGVNHFRNDIYDRDQPLWQALSKPLNHVEH